ncbi:MAG: phage holin family protein [Candidatus Dormibacteraceae bacterium]
MSSPVDADLKRPARSGDLAAEVVHDAQRLVSLEVALAKQEIKDLAMTNAIAAGMVAAGVLLVMLGVLVAAPSVVVWLVPWHWQAAVAWVVVYVLLGISLGLMGKARFALRLPARTLASLKENKEWALRQMRSTVR